MYYFEIVLVGLLAVGCYCSEKEVITLPPGGLEAAVKCIVETDVNPELLPRLGSAKLYSENINDNRSLQKFLYCVFSKINYMKKNGHLKLDKAIDLFAKSSNREPITKLIESCNEENGNDGPETIYKIFGCVIKNSPVKFELL